MEAKIIPDLPIEEYHDHPAISKTTCHAWHQAATPAHFKARKEPQKDHLNYGQVLHMAVLEPELYQEKVIVAPAEVLNKSGGRSGKKWQEWEEEQKEEGRSILLPGEKRALDYTLEELFQKPYNREAAELLDPKGISELSFFWHDYDVDYPFKCRPDKLPGNEIVVDLKTAATAEPIEFGKAAANFKYHWSAKITLTGVSVCTKVTHVDYRFVVVEKEEPYGIIVYKVDYDDIILADTQLWDVKQNLAKALKSGKYPNYPDGTHPLHLPYWEKKQTYGSIYN